MGDGTEEIAERADGNVVTREAPVRASFLRARFLNPVKALLVQGLSPEKIALTLAVSLVLAAFPVIGATTILCTTAALVLKLNMPLTQAVNYFSAPIQLVLLIPFMRLGSLFFGGEGVRFSLTEIVKMMGVDPLLAVSTLWASTVQAIGAWALLSPLAGLLIYAALLPPLRALTAKAAESAAGAAAARAAKSAKNPRAG